MERVSLDEQISHLEKAIHISRYSSAGNFCEGKNVLDIGCGNGYGTALLAKFGAKNLLGVDISQEAIDNAKNNFSRSNLEFKVADALELNHFNGEIFDVICCFETIEHVNNPEKLLENLDKLTAPDGKIIISCPNDYWYYENGIGNPFHLHRWKFEEFQKDISKKFSKVKYYVGTASIGFANIPYSPGTRHGKWYASTQQLKGLIIDEIKIDSPSYYLAIIEKHSEISASISSGGFVSLGMSDFYGSPNNQYSSSFEFPKELISKIEVLSKRMAEQDQVISGIVSQSEVKLGLLGLVIKKYLRQLLRRMKNE